MARILNLISMPDGRVGVVLDVPPDAGSSITLWTEAERETHLLEAAKADDAIEVLEQELHRMRAENERLRACLHAMAAADDDTTAASFKSVAYDVVMNSITSSVAEYQLVRRSKPVQ